MFGLEKQYFVSFSLLCKSLWRAVLIQKRVLAQHSIPAVVISWFLGQRTGQARDIYPHRFPAVNYLQLWRFHKLSKLHKLQWSFIPNTHLASACTYVNFLASKMDWSFRKSLSALLHSVGRATSFGLFASSSYQLCFMTSDTPVIHNNIINVSAYIYTYPLEIYICIYIYLQ